MEVRHGALCLRELVLQVPVPAAGLVAEVKIGGRTKKHKVKQDRDEVRIILSSMARIGEGECVEVELRWS